MCTSLLFVLFPRRINLILSLGLRRSYIEITAKFCALEICEIIQCFQISSINMESEYVIEGNARIIAKNMPNSSASKCICYRPHSNIICNGCGFWTKGRVRYCCPEHPKIVFLYDYAQCPRCKSYDFMLTEI